ncbi:hypothetical protein NQ318_007027 [Aromia moschata]|uniref:Tetraspanin n=1 Tax=Aromia moschata TaxID=1265417 RepID=A0AAV8Y2E6_9CUCU|nr:hypothetical protein NQ318_007027 [Aromia moschata]
MTTTFSTLLIVIFVLEVVAAVCGILLKSRTEKYLVNTLEDTIKHYNSNNTEIEVIWDRVQREFYCCGVVNASDWRNHTEGLPMSCCSIPTGARGNFSCTETNAYQVGCLQEFGDFIRSQTSIIEGVGIAMAIIQLLGIVFSCYLAKSIRSDYETV